MSDLVRHRFCAHVCTMKFLHRLIEIILEHVIIEIVRKKRCKRASYLIHVRNAYARLCLRLFPDIRKSCIYMLIKPVQKTIRRNPKLSDLLARKLAGAHEKPAKPVYLHVVQARRMLKNMVLHPHVVRHYRIHKYEVPKSCFRRIVEKRELKLDLRAGIAVRAVPSRRRIYLYVLSYEIAQRTEYAGLAAV